MTTTVSAAANRKMMAIPKIIKLASLRRGLPNVCIKNAEREHIFDARNFG